ncbi:MAG: alpha/beta fold hydrolase [Pseudomonadota bacterium]
MPKRQHIRMLRTSDGVNLAWASGGSGPALVRASTWLTHLEEDWKSPVWRHWLDFLADHFQVIRYDERGCGMSDWEVEDCSWERWQEDFHAVVDAARPEKPFAILGVSQGAVAAIQYAHRHPENVSHLILCGAYARGWRKRDQSDGAQKFRAIVELTRLGWGQENPVYRQLFTARFVPEGTPEQLDWFNELCVRTARPDVAARLLEARAEPDVSGLLADINVPTLVFHATHDEVVPLAEGRLLAARIPNARFVQLESRNHILLEQEPSWQRFKDEVLEFTGIAAAPGDEDPLFDVLSPREREILVHVANGDTNTQIGVALSISEKTVRNHMTHIFEKLGVRSRAQAIVLAKDKHLSAER